MPDTEAKVFKAEKVSVLADLGLVVGKAMIFTEKGEEYWDLQDDHIPKLVGVEAILDFSKSRVHKVMHEGEVAGEFECLFPITDEICKALDIQADWEGAVVGFRPEPDIMAKYVSGEFTGFSIAGGCTYVEEAA